MAIFRISELIKIIKTYNLTQRDDLQYTHGHKTEDAAHFLMHNVEVENLAWDQYHEELDYVLLFSFYK